MKRYVDCDGVILNTEEHLLDQYYELKKENPTLKKRIYLTNLDWERHLEQTTILNNAIEILKSHNPKDVYILT